MTPPVKQTQATPRDVEAVRRAQEARRAQDAEIARQEAMRQRILAEGNTKGFKAGRRVGQTEGAVVASVGVALLFLSGLGVYLLAVSDSASPPHLGVILGTGLLVLLSNLFFAGLGAVLQLAWGSK